MRSKTPIALAAIIAAIAFSTATSSTQAQVVSDSIGANAQAAWNTASAGTMALRAPGNLVDLARAEFSSAHNLMIGRSRFGPTIDQAGTENELTLRQQVLVDVIETSFDTMNGALLGLLNAIRISGGLDPILPGSGGTSGLTSLLGSITGTL
jgi:hypothetical protein